MPCISEAEDQAYLSRQILTCIGNKRSLLGTLDSMVESVRARLGNRRLRVLDAFSGSGIVSRLLKRHAAWLGTIDLEDYAAAAARCYLTNRESVDWNLLEAVVRDLNARVEGENLPKGFIEDLYAPRDEARIGPDDRVFYTRANARRLDNYRRMLETVPADLRGLLLGPLLGRASVHANTSGVFKGFHKDRLTGIGRFGGTRGDALSRIRGEIVLDPPVLSAFSCDHQVWCGDSNRIAPTVEDLDLVYLDPPYNQHPYGSNYFMLNLLVTYQRPQAMSRVSGIPEDWRRSDYNVRARARDCFAALVASLQSRFLLVSFNNEGFISRAEMMALLERVGRVRAFDLPYTVFRGCRNIHSRSVRVVEQMFLVET